MKEKSDTVSNDENFREVEDGDILSGHGNAEQGFPSLLITNSHGHGSGELACSIESFHLIRVRNTATATILQIGQQQGRNAITMTLEDGAIVTYHSPKPATKIE
jgi:hypothetical protein